MITAGVESPYWEPSGKENTADEKTPTISFKGDFPHNTKG